MNKCFLGLLISGLLAISFLGCQTAETAQHMEDASPERMVKVFNEDWEFTKDSTGTQGWETVRLPHIPEIAPLVVNDQWQGTCWYRKMIQASPTSDRKSFLRFEGVMHEADVWVDGTYIKKHVGGYLPFLVDVTSYLEDGVAEIKVRVNNEDNPEIPPGKPLEDLDFNYYGGIYRDVFLIETNKVHITDAVNAEEPASGGILVYFNEVSAEKAKGILKVHFKNELDSAAEVYFTATLKDKDTVVGEWKTNPVKVEAHSAQEIVETLQVDSPKLWSPQNPHLYELQVTLYADGEVVDNITETTGIRNIALQEDGFYLNGEKMFIRGTNRHQEYPYVGYALSPEADFRDAVKIKNAGFDFVRLSHYPQSRAFLEVCDELGLIVMNCIPGWQFFGGEEFRENSYQNVVDMIRRDRNHPSIFFWEVSLNESSMDKAYMEKVNALLDRELPFDDILSAGWIDHEAYDVFIPARQHARPPHYWNRYKDGERLLFIGEYGDWGYYAQNAGFNQKAFGDLKPEERTSRQLRGVGEKGLLQQALNFQESANSNRKGKGTIGDANWLMFDYNRGYAPDIEASGISDIFRLPKFTYYFYKSQRPADEHLANPALESGPMVYIASYWLPTSSTDIKVFSNCDEVELFLNGKSIGRNTPTKDEMSTHLKQPPFVFHVPAFEEGTLKAVGYIDEEKVAEHSVSTAGEPAKIQLEADRSGKDFGANDVFFIYAKILDKNNVQVHENGIPLTFSLVSGKGEVIGGEDLVVKTLETGSVVESEAGISTVLLGTQATGTIVLKVEGKGLEGDEITIEIFDN